MRQICTSVAVKVSACSRKHQASPTLAMMQPADGRADEARRVERAGMQRHRIRQQLAVADQFGQEGMAHRDLAGEEKAAQQCDGDEAAHADPAGEGQPGEQQAQQAHRAQHDEQQAPARVAVGKQAGNRRHHHRRCQRGEADDAQHQGRAAEPIGQPAQGHVVRETADQRDRLADEVAAELRFGQRREAAQGCNTTRPTTRPLARSLSAWLTCANGRRSSGISGSLMRCASATSSRRSFSPAT